MHTFLIAVVLLGIAVGVYAFVAKKAAAPTDPAAPAGGTGTVEAGKK